MPVNPCEPPPENKEPLNRNRFQFHLSSLLAFVTVACIVFAMVGYWGVSGLMERAGVAVFFASPFVPLIEFVYWWRKNVEDRPPG